MSNEGPPRLTDLGHPNYRLKQPIRFDLVANGPVVVIANDSLRITAIGNSVDEALTDAAKQLIELYEQHREVVEANLSLLPVEQQFYDRLASVIEPRT